MMTAKTPGIMDIPLAETIGQIIQGQMMIAMASVIHPI